MRMRSRRVLGSAGAAIVVAGMGGALASARAPAAAPPAPPPDSARDAQPILAASCVRCHRAGRAEGGLRLGTRESLLRGRDSGGAAVRGAGQERVLHER